MKCERCGAEYSGACCLHCVWRMYWGERIHEETPQQERMKRAQNIPKVDNLDTAKGVCNITGSEPTPYTTTLLSCTCRDFRKSFSRKDVAPCKHIYRLAHELGIINVGEISKVPIASTYVPYPLDKEKLDSLAENSKRELFELSYAFVCSRRANLWIYHRNEPNHSELLRKGILEEELDRPERLLDVYHIKDLRDIIKANNLRCPRTKKETISLVYSLWPSIAQKLIELYHMVRLKEATRGAQWETYKYLRETLFPVIFGFPRDGYYEFWGNFISEPTD